MSILPKILLLICLLHCQLASSLRVHCGGRCSSGNEIRLPLCYCDPDCGVYGDCCVDRPTCGNGTGNDRPSDFQVSENIVIGYDSPNGFLPASYWMVSACPANWSDPNCSLFQEQCANGSAILPPVSSPDGIVYKNMYCAACHNVVNFTVWSYVYTCSELNEFNFAQCELLLFKPPNVSTTYSPRQCTSRIASSPLSEEPQPVTLLSNFTVTVILDMSGVVEVRSSNGSTIIQCAREHLSDLVSDVCTTIFSIQELANCSKCSNGNDEGSSLQSSPMDTYNHSILTDSSNNDTTLYLSGIECNSILTLSGEFNITCDSTDCDETEPSAILEVVHLIGSSIAILCCLMILVTYSLFSEMRTLVGKLLMNLAFAFLSLDVTNVILLIVAPSQTMPLALHLGHRAITTIPQGGIAAAQIIYIFFSSARFSWMTATGFEICRTFYLTWKLRPITSKHRHLFIIYLLVGWGLPLSCAVLSTIVGYATNNLRRTNQVHHTYIALLLLMSIILAIIAAVFFYLASHQFENVGEIKSMKRSGIDARYIRVYIALVSVNGLILVLALVIFVSFSAIWAVCIFIFFLTLQPFAICIVFVFTKKVGKWYWALLRCRRKKEMGNP